MLFDCNLTLNQDAVTYIITRAWCGEEQNDAIKKQIPLKYNSP